MLERPEAAENVSSGRVVTRAFIGESVDHVIAVGKHEIRAHCHPGVSVAPGTDVYLRLEAQHLSLVPLN